MSQSHEAIRAARAAINDAIARRDAAAIGAFFLPSYHVITARSMQYASREASARGWAAMFKRDAMAAHTGAADEIQVYEDWGVAAENGRWTATVGTRTGPLSIEGVYAAKWQNTPEGWRLQAEIYTPLRVDSTARSDSRGSGGTLL